MRKTPKQLTVGEETRLRAFDRLRLDVEHELEEPHSDKRGVQLYGMLGAIDWAIAVTKGER